MYMDRISCDIGLQKNENCRLLRKSYNPILEDLLEAEERVMKHELNRDAQRQENIRNMESHLRDVNEQSSMSPRLQGPEPGRRAVSIMEGSLSRDRAEIITNKMRQDLKGPGYYYPKHMFGKKVAQSITIPREHRRSD